MAFRIEELVPKQVYEDLGEEAWELVAKELKLSIMAIKLAFPEGTMTINNWVWGGNRQWSGLRTPDSPYYSKTSQHTLDFEDRVFRAIDAVFSHYETEEVRQYIIDNPEEFPFIKGIELDVSWLHIDTREREKLLQFRA